MARIDTFTRDRAAPLSDAEQARLRALSAKGNRSPEEAFELGGLVAKGRSSRAGQEFLREHGLDQLAAGRQRRTQPTQPRPRKDPPVSDSQYRRNLEAYDRYEREHPW